MTHFILATAGHVDHGKSALVKALTGTDPDRLPEEKQRGITIDLGFAELPLTTKDGRQFSVGIVDVPGHEDFVRNMIAGVGSIDVALLVVAADDGWMPQTEEHLQILSYLGVPRAIVAVTKSDLGRVEEVTNEIGAQLTGTVFSAAAIVPVSAQTGLGIPELKSAIVAELSAVAAPKDSDKARLFVDRAFTLHGIGTVVTGTLSGGKLQTGKSVAVAPPNISSRIRSMQSHGQTIEIAEPGMRTAINLPELEIGDSSRAIKRGDVVTADELPVSDTVDVLIQRSRRVTDKDPAARPLKNGSMVDAHHGTMRVAAKLVLLEGDTLRRGEEGLAQLRLEAPFLAFLGDQLVLRDRSQRHTLGGGIVLDPDAVRANFRNKAQKKFLRARAARHSDIRVCILSEVERRGTVPLTGLLQKSRFSAVEIAETVRLLAGAGELVACGNIVAGKIHWQQLRQRAEDAVDAAHARSPERQGLDINLLRAEYKDQSPAVFSALLSELCANGFVHGGEAIARKEHRAALAPNLTDVAARILDSLAAKPFDPPAVKQIIADRAARDALNFLIKSGSVTQISPDVIIRSEDFENAKTIVANFIRQRGPATVSALRQELQSSRRVLVPLLERLDREGFTRRINDQRVLATI